MPGVKTAVRSRNGSVGRSVTRAVTWTERLEVRRLLSAAIEPTFRIGGQSPTPAGTAAPLVTTRTFVPSEIRRAYGFDSLSFGSAAVTGDGSGQTIAIIDAYNAPTIAADLATFNAKYGLPTSTLTVVNQTGGTTLPGNDPAGAGDSWAVETSLDVEWAHAVAPKANILLVLATSPTDANLNVAVNTARNAAGVSVVSMSYGSDETASDYTGTNDTYYTTPAGHAGVTFVASSGDAGAYSDSSASTRIVGYPASSPKVVGVGGTSLTAASDGTYTAEAGWGYGTSSYASGGSGGGISKYAAKPSYQSSTIVTQSSTYRCVPDVSLDADDHTGVAVIDSYDFGNTTPQRIGGTSLSAPMWAGVMALVNQDRSVNGLTSMDGATQTLPAIYGLSTADFHDITTGSNYYSAAAGYDLVTGRGTPIAPSLVPDLAGVGATTPTPTPTGTPTIASFAASPTSVTTGTNLTLVASGVTETNGTISSVTFYRESNGTAGLQTAADTLLGTGTANGTTYTLTTSTTGLTAGTYTYYAVATDASATASAASSTTATVTAVPTATGSELAGWGVTGQTAYGTSPLPATAVGTGVTVSTGLTRGAGVTTTNTAAANAWGGNGWSTTTAAAGVAANQTVTVGLTVAAGYTASLASVDLNYRRSSSGPANGYWQYQVDGGTWALAADVTNEFPVSTSGGGTITELSLAGIAALQNLPAATVVNLRLTPYAATAATGTFYVYDLTGDDLTVNGTTAAVTGTPGPLVLAGPAAYLKLDADGARVDVFANATGTGTPAQQVALSQITTMSYAGTAAADSLTVDFSAGNPLVAGGLSYDGAGGTNALTVVGTAGNDAVTVNATTVALSAAFGTATITYANATAVTVAIANGGADTVTQSAQPAAALTVTGAGATDALAVNAGTFTVPAPAAAAGNVDWPVGTLAVATGATVTLASAAAATDRTVLDVSHLTLAGTLDLGGNAMVLRSSAVSSLATPLASGFAGGTWAGTGLTSSVARADAAHLTAVAAVANTGSLYTTFAGQPVATTDVLVRVTYYGDANLDGTVSAADYTRVDVGAVTGLTGWVNGDFNYDGAVDGSDYALIDNAFNRQSAATPAAAVATVHAKPAAAVTVGSTADAFASTDRKHKSSHRGLSRA